MQGAGTPVHELMSKPVVVAEPQESLAQAAARMHERRVGSVVVTEADRCVGILTERDLVRAVAAPVGAVVADWMTPDPVTVSPETTWNDATSLLREGGFRHLPVLSAGGELMGIVSLRDLMKVAYLVLEGAATEPAEAPRGLAGVAVARTTLSDVDGKAGFFHYRGYDGVALAERVTFEDVWHLVHEGDLPGPDELDAFAARTREARHLPPEVAALLPEIASLGPRGSLASLRTAVSALGPVLGCRSWLDQSPQETKDQAMRISALLPVLATALYRLGGGSKPVEPHGRLGYAANYLYMLHGREPEPEHVQLLERYLLLAAEHGFNNSAFTARVITSSGADLAAAVSGAIGAFSGPMHGGAVGRVPSVLEEIGDIDNVEPWIRQALDRGERVPGFGHPVYETTDPRSATLRELVALRGGGRVDVAMAFERTAVQLINERKRGRRREANVDFYAGLALGLAGVPEDLFDCTFAVARVVGWTAHVLEQIADNRIFRPAAHYVGPSYPRTLP
jgi:citrate synthase